MDLSRVERRFNLDKSVVKRCINRNTGRYRLKTSTYFHRNGMFGAARFGKLIACFTRLLWVIARSASGTLPLSSCALVQSRVFMEWLLKQHSSPVETPTVELDRVKLWKRRFMYSVVGTSCGDLYPSCCYCTLNPDIYRTVDYSPFILKQDHPASHTQNRTFCALCEWRYICNDCYSRCANHIYFIFDSKIADVYGCCPECFGIYLGILKSEKVPHEMLKVKRTFDGSPVGVSVFIVRRFYGKQRDELNELCQKELDLLYNDTRIPMEHYLDARRKSYLRYLMRLDSYLDQKLLLAQE